MAILLELFLTLLLEYVFTFPGAFLRWSYHRLIGKPIPFKACATRNIGLNYLISVVLVVAVVLLLKLRFA